MNDMLASEKVAPRPKVAVIYHMFPHYRAPILRALAASDRYDFQFWGSHKAVEGIVPFVGDSTVTIEEIQFTPKGRGGKLSGIMGPVLSKDIPVIVLIGNPNFVQTWSAAILGRLAGKRVLFWSHGWLRKERPIKQFLRNLYFRLGNGVLVYDNRARKLAGASGFPENRVHPIYNSLDFPASSVVFDKLQKKNGAGRSDVGFPEDRSVVICVARLISVCRLDMLIDAAAILRSSHPLTIVIVGDGPCRADLEAQATASSVDVRFVGAVYDEDTIGPLIYNSDVTVSPGKVGLLAIHSLSYGTPVVTHGSLDDQMPEVEALQPGVTGAFFKYGDTEDLARVLGEWLDEKCDRPKMRDACRQVVLQRYNPQSQANIIENVIDQAMS